MVQTLVKNKAQTDQYFFMKKPSDQNKVSEKSQSETEATADRQVAHCSAIDTTEYKQFWKASVF